MTDRRKWKTGRPAAALHWWDTEQTSATDRALAEIKILTLVHADEPDLPVTITQHTLLTASTQNTTTAYFHLLPAQGYADALYAIVLC